MIRQVFDTYGFIILSSFLVVLFVLESMFQLRRRVQSRFQRIVINTLLAMPAFVLLRLAVIPVMVWLASENEQWELGLNYLYHLPAWMEYAITFLLLDYSIYWWHIILHRMPLMWRFHLVHHSDKDMDVSTAFRFHFGEMFGTIVFRSFALLLIGASPVMVLVYEIVFEAATEFHHSNTRLPFRFEKWLNYLIVTPRMHGIHHSIVKKETDSNYATVFSFWDRLHRTARLNVHQDDIVIGVPSYTEDELTVKNLLKMPFEKLRTWQHTDRPETGSRNKLKP